MRVTSERKAPPSTVKAVGIGGGSSSALRAFDLERFAAAAPHLPEEILREMPSRLRTIIERVGEEYELSADQVLTGRQTTATEARHCVFWLSRKVLSSMSAATVAAALHRDPTTVRDGARVFYDRLKADRKLTARMSNLLKQLNEVGD